MAKIADIRDGRGLQVTVVVRREFFIRMWIAKALFRAAAWVMRSDIEVLEEEPKNNLTP